MLRNLPIPSLFWLAVACCQATFAAEPPQPPPVRLACFIPKDRELIPGHVERIDRVMSEVQRFYREGMAANGYGPLTFALDRERDGRLRVLEVRGREPMSGYGRDDADKVRSEVKAAFAAKGVDIDKETVVIFELLLAWEGKVARELGPYVGGGDHLAGTAWVYDDALLDPRQLGSKEPGGYYGRPCSIGEFNSHYIGGVAHELGHAFGLPHACEREVDRDRGHALMGGGNHTYGEELRGEGRGSFLSAASAMLLARSRPFAGNLPGAREQGRSELLEFSAAFAQGKLRFTGRLKAYPPAFGIAAYNDLESIPANYDAVAWTCPVNASGAFQLEVGELRPGDSQLRLIVCHTNGGTSQFAYDYKVDDRRQVDPAVFNEGWLLDQAVKCWARGDRPATKAAVQRLEADFPQAREAQQKARHLLNLLDPAPLVAATDVPKDQTSIPLSRLRATAEEVGWLRPARDRVPAEGGSRCFLEVGGRFAESGFYAHAPSRYRFDLGGGWKRLRVAYGLQDGHAGSVVFVVRGDGKELFRSPVVKESRQHALNLSLEGVHELELVTENAGDGASNDWGVWLSPVLER